MRLQRPVAWRHAAHFCGWDRTCRSLHTFWYLYLNFLADKNGRPVRINLTPPHVARRIQRWEDETWESDDD